MKLAIPSTLIVCFEWWIWEIGGILAGECCFCCHPKFSRQLQRGLKCRQRCNLSGFVERFTLWLLLLVVKTGLFVFNLTPGVLGELDLAAQHIIMEIGAITYMVHARLGSGRLL